MAENTLTVQEEQQAILTEKSLVQLIFIKHQLVRYILAYGRIIDFMLFN